MRFNNSRSTNGKHTGIGIIPDLLAGEWLLCEQQSKNLGQLPSMLNSPVGYHQIEIKKQWEFTLSHLERLGLPTDLGVTYQVHGYNVALEYYLLHESHHNKSAQLLALSNVIKVIRQISAALLKRREGTALHCYPRLTDAMKVLIMSSMEDGYLAGRSRTGEGAQIAHENRLEKQEEAIRLAREMHQKNPHLSKNDIYTYLAPQLAVSQRTVKRYLNGIDITK
ncbi:hypothetical protein [Vibrio breoganii]|uniref:hypothetical protein n=1 Tax=Vibrio breoganii TaxID=553239 RepID=UPI000C83D57C|nr:hypothetical protein [Vibrio breoganii]PMG07210.1 hypothetical protein BCV00_08490 [Vibrio breoganii]PMK31885.1 hypothetical protein BCU03_06015 [Vibrio breoganii]